MFITTSQIFRTGISQPDLRISLRAIESARFNQASWSLQVVTRGELDPRRYHRKNTAQVMLHTHNPVRITITARKLATASLLGSLGSFMAGLPSRPGRRR